MTRDSEREMGGIDHTHPHTGEAFGANGGVFTRGPAAADGGTEDDEMRDVEHVAPDGDGANEVWERGLESQPTDDAGADGDATDETDEGDEGDETAAESGTDAADDAAPADPDGTDGAKPSDGVRGAKDVVTNE
jgi:hypothetical protein